jgi:hypothetical protein
MSREAEIIIGREIDDPPAVERADGGLLVVQYTQLKVCAFGFQLVELGGQER